VRFWRLDYGFVKPEIEAIPEIRIFLMEFACKLLILIITWNGIKIAYT